MRKLLLINKWCINKMLNFYEKDFIFFHYLCSTVPSLLPERSDYIIGRSTDVWRLVVEEALLKAFPAGCLHPPKLLRHCYRIVSIRESFQHLATFAMKHFYFMVLIFIKTSAPEKLPTLHRPPLGVRKPS